MRCMIGYVFVSHCVDVMQCNVVIYIPLVGMLTQQRPDFAGCAYISVMLFRQSHMYTPPPSPYLHKKRSKHALILV